MRQRVDVEWILRERYVRNPSLLDLSAFPSFSLSDTLLNLFLIPTSQDKDHVLVAPLKSPQRAKQKAENDYGEGDRHIQIADFGFTLRPDLLSLQIFAFPLSPNSNFVYLLTNHVSLFGTQLLNSQGPLYPIWQTS